MAQTLQRLGKLTVGLAAHHLQELIAGQHQLAYEVHQILEKADVDADVLFGDRRLGGGLGLGSVVDIDRFLSHLLNGYFLGSHGFLRSICDTKDILAGFLDDG